MVSDARLRSVRRLARELARESAPELDWERVERDLMNRAPQVGQSTEQRSSFSGRWMAVSGAMALAAAAAAALWVSHASHVRSPSEPVDVATKAVANGTMNGDALALHTVVQASSNALTVEHRGQASWTLEPHSRAHVVERGALLTIALDSGAVSVRVVPHPGGEPFAVEVDRTRVAAHGTRFRVERVADGVHVDVSEGVVAVGATTDRGHTHGFTLPAPSRGAFGLDGATGTVWSASGAASVGDHPFAVKTLPKRVRAHAPPTAAPPISPAASAHTLPVASAPRTLERVPTIAQIDDGLQAFQTAANQCFARRAGPSEGVRVTVGVTALIDIAPSGHVDSVEFVPPLAPDDQSCVEDRLDSVTFAASRDGMKVERTLEFSR